jgi:hypothetical protein
MAAITGASRQLACPPGISPPCRSTAAPPLPTRPPAGEPTSAHDEGHCITGRREQKGKDHGRGDGGTDRPVSDLRPRQRRPSQPSLLVDPHGHGAVGHSVLYGACDLAGLRRPVWLYPPQCEQPGQVASGFQGCDQRFCVEDKCRHAVPAEPDPARRPVDPPLRRPVLPHLPNTCTKAGSGDLNPGIRAAETLVVAAVAHQLCAAGVSLLLSTARAPTDPWCSPCSATARHRFTAAAGGRRRRHLPKQPASSRGRLRSASSSAVAAALPPWISARPCRPGMRSRRSHVGADSALVNVRIVQILVHTNTSRIREAWVAGQLRVHEGLACSARYLLTSWEGTRRPHPGEVSCYMLLLL